MLQLCTLNTCFSNILIFVVVLFQNPSVHHPKTIPLGLLNEKIVHVSASAIRCSVSTESGRVATWMDETLQHAAGRLEHPAQSFTEFQLDSIVSLHTCILYSGNLKSCSL